MSRNWVKMMTLAFGVAARAISLELLEQHRGLRVELDVVEQVDESLELGDLLPVRRRRHRAASTSSRASSTGRSSRARPRRRSALAPARAALSSFSIRRSSDCRSASRAAAFSFWKIDHQEAEGVVLRQRATARSRRARTRSPPRTPPARLGVSSTSQTAATRGMKPPTTAFRLRISTSLSRCLREQLLDEPSLALLGVVESSSLCAPSEPASRRPRRAARCLVASSSAGQRSTARRSG